MLNSPLRQLVQRMRDALRRDRQGRVGKRRRFARLRLEGLEDRTVPSTVNWVGGSGNWNDASHWVDSATLTNHVPVMGDDAVINVSGVTVTHGNTGTDAVQSVSVSSGTLSLTAGTLNVAGALALSGNGTFRLAGGTLSNATIIASGGATLALTSSGGTLAGVTVASGVTVDGTAAGALLYVTGGLTLDGVLDVGAADASTAGEVVFTNSQTLSGGGAVVLGGSANNVLYAYGPSLAATLTIGPGITVQGGGGRLTGYYLNDSVVNDGTIIAGTTGGTVTIAGSNWTNNGTIQATGGGTLNGQGTNSNFATGTLTGGTWKVFAGSTLRLLNAAIVTNAATIVLDGSNSNFYGDSSTTNALVGFATNNGDFTIENGRNFTTTGDFINNGTLTLAPGIFAVTGNYSQGASGTLNVALDGTSPGTSPDGGYGQLTASTATLAAGASLNTTLGFVSTNGDTFTVLSAPGGVSGTFNGLPDGATFVLSDERYRANYLGSSVVLTHFANVATHLNFIVSPTVTAGTPFPITVQALDGNNQLDTGYTDAVHFTATNGAMADYTFQPGDLGQRTFNLVLRRAGTLGVTGMDTSSGITGGTSFTIVPAAVDHLVFLQPPTDTAAGQTLGPVQVALVDAYGNVETGDNSDMVTVSPGVDPTGGTLSGTLTVTVVNGVATFGDLSINQPGMGYTLHVTAGGSVPNIDSGAFNIL